MCGIAGYIDFKEAASEQVLHRMTDAVHHRGPDGEGYFIKETKGASVALGHRRLSIIDLSEAAAQPMHYDGLHLVFNGEIYNYAEVRSSLEQMGHQFATHSDTEVILHSYRQWGLDAVTRWRGMFALVMFDEKSSQIVCLRDRLGAKPFYYYWNGDRLIFSSELKGIIAHPRFEKEVCTRAAAAYFQYGYVPQPFAVYKNTFKLEAAHSLVLDLEKRDVVTRPYWNVYDHYNKPKISLGIEEAVEQTEAVLEESFAYRMVADVPVGVFLSGGFDSTCVTALLQKNTTEKIKTFTIGNTDARFDEARYARQVAAHLGTDHTEYFCTPAEALDIIPHIPTHFDEPFGDSSAIPTMLVSKLARQKVTVALSADAGDEIFAGYNRYAYLMKYNRGIKKLPSPVRKMVAGAMESISSESIPYFRNQYNFHSRYQKLKGLMQQPGLQEMLKSSVEVFRAHEREALFAQSQPELQTLHISNLLDAQADPLSYMMAVDTQTYLPDDILQKVDRATMSVSLEGREPFLDQHIIEWAARLPSSYKFYKGEKKYLLKQIVYRYVPRQLMDRPKMGFSIPIEQWLKNELRDMVMEFISPAALSHGMFNTAYAISLRDQFLAGRTELHVKLWHLLMFQMWHHRWMR